MGEIERLVKEGKIPEKFLINEVKCNFSVTIERKKIWAIQIDLMQKVDEICKRYSLRYWVFYGTLLGAARHQGFIPWDDDLDIAMPRRDYERFLRIAIKELETPYIIRSYLNDNLFGYSRATITNIRTTYIDNVTIEKTGMSVDLFPLDGLSDNNIMLYIDFKRINFWEICLHSHALFKRGGRYKLLNFLIHYGIIEFKYPDIIRRISRIAAKHGFDNSKRVGCIVYKAYSLKKSVFNGEWFKDTVYLKFEYLDVPVPIGYKKILETVYSDYMSFPPESKRGEWHDMVLNPDVSFTQYKEKV